MNEIQCGDYFVQNIDIYIEREGERERERERDVLFNSAVNSSY